MCYKSKVLQTGSFEGKDCGHTHTNTRKSKPIRLVSNLGRFCCHNKAYLWKRRPACFRSGYPEADPEMRSGMKRCINNMLPERPVSERGKQASGWETIRPGRGLRPTPQRVDSPAPAGELWSVLHLELSTPGMLAFIHLPP